MGLRFPTAYSNPSSITDCDGTGNRRAIATFSEAGMWQRHLFRIDPDFPQRANQQQQLAAPDLYSKAAVKPNGTLWDTSPDQCPGNVPVMSHAKTLIQQCFQLYGTFGTLVLPKFSLQCCSVFFVKNFSDGYQSGKFWDK